MQIITLVPGDGLTGGMEMYLMNMSNEWMNTSQVQRDAGDGHHGAGARRADHQLRQGAGPGEARGQVRGVQYSIVQHSTVQQYR